MVKETAARLAARSLPQQPQELLQGVDSVTGAGKNHAVLRSDVVDSSSSFAKVSICQGYKEVTEALHITASASASYLSMVSVDAKTELTNTLKITDTSVHIIVYAERWTEYTATELHMKDGIETADAAKFLRLYGDSVVTAITKGAYFYAIYSFHSTTVDEANAIKTNFQAKGISSGVEASASLETNFEKAMKDNEITVESTMHIEGIKSPIYPATDKIMEHIPVFMDDTKQPLDSGVILSYKTQAYNEVVGWPGDSDDFLAILRNRDYLVDDDDCLMAKWLDMVKLRNSIDSILDMYQYYIPSFKASDPTLTARRAEVIQQIGTKTSGIRQQFEDYTNNPIAPLADKIHPESTLRAFLPALFIGAPTASYTVMHSEDDDSGQPTGAHVDAFSQHPRPFDDIIGGRGAQYHISHRVRISAVQARGGDYLDAITTWYESGIPAGASWSTKHGGGGGNDGNKIVFPLNENTGTASRIMGISSSVFVLTPPAGLGNLHVTFVTGIRLWGSEGAATEGGRLPEELLRTLTFPEEKGRFMLGFSGWADEYVFWVIPVVVQLAPATWSGAW